MGSLRRLSVLGLDVKIEAVDELLHFRVDLVECGGRLTIVVHVAQRGNHRESNLERCKSEVSRSQGVCEVSEASATDWFELGKYSARISG